MRPQRGLLLGLPLGVWGSSEGWAVSKRVANSQRKLTDEVGDGDDRVIVGVGVATSTEGGVVHGHLARVLSGEVLPPACERLADEAVA